MFLFKISKNKKINLCCLGVLFLFLIFIYTFSHFLMSKEQVKVPSVSKNIKIMQEEDTETDLLFPIMKENTEQ